MAKCLELLQKRKERQRHKLRTLSTGRPRLSVHRTNKHTYAQIIDDTTRVTMVAVSTLSPAAKGIVSGGNKDAAIMVGKLIAEEALKKGISSVVFDRSGYLYHGRIKALADSARSGGLQF
ncbi:MAG: 50S ribosomal protein L18 [Alphaproteobacteria bacterium]|nr:50S ribosomal protein L18 [Alphaproteobacteria bacterium]